MPREVIKIMVSSTVYSFEKDLRVLCATIESYKSAQYKYKVLNSHIGTVYVAPGASNMEACLRAVDECDFFLGIIMPRYGSGITHQEFTRAIEQDKPRGFLSHYSVRYAREILAQYMYTDIKNRLRNPDFEFKKTPVFEDARIIDMYNAAIQDAQPMYKRRWAHEFGHFDDDEMKFIETEFKDINRFKADLDELNRLKALQK
ncbi:MAG: DUF4062 domain-containing protein [Bacteroidales bacterium]|nr:DUF4062 domain-containing protein [Bacteroidales bacterium]